MKIENPVHVSDNPGYGLWRYRPWNVCYRSTLGFVWAWLRPTLPGRNVSGRALTKRERDNY